MVLFFARARRSRRGRRSQLSHREFAGQPSLIVEDLDLDDERGTTTMDDLGLGCQGPLTRVSDNIDG
jgi:hypothetical protein